MQLKYHPLGISSKRTVLGMPTGEGAPQGLRGWGVRLKGSRGRVPLVGLDKVQGLFFCHARHGSAEPTSVADPYRF